jgi:transcriptional regulator GlxA family with amidase domain
MNRREVLSNAALGAIAATLATSAHAKAVTTPRPLQPPKAGKIPVAVLISEDAQVIDFAGPWEVFQGVHVHSRGSSMEEMMPFQLFTVAPTKDPIRATGGLRIVPDYTFEDAPQARVIVIPAQSGLGKYVEPGTKWLTQAAAAADVTMSVCTGAFILGHVGLLDGLSATTYHRRLDEFEKQFPKVKLLRGVRFVENERISTSAGLSAGIDLALRVVERYFGREVAADTATNLEYEGRGWVT